MMLGFLLARSGVNVTVLEKHADFFRDFRGDTIHPSTLEVMNELGILDAFLKLPHQEVEQLRGYFGESSVTIADFSHVPGRCKFIAFTPQWDFLNFIAEQASRFPNFHLKMECEATGLLQEDGRVTGVRAETSEGETEIHADLTVAADGRHSTLRKAAKFEPINLGAPMDVLWVRISRKPSDPGQTLGRVRPGHFIAMINRNDYWQCAYVIPKDSFKNIQAAGLQRFREALGQLVPFLSDRLQELKGWDDIKVLTVAVDRLPRWHRPGFLCIGDAAHAMSPIGGVGINLAIQDAVATSNLLTVPLQKKTLTGNDLRNVQKRREFPTRMTQGLQLFIQNHFVKKVLENQNEAIKMPFVVKLMERWPILTRIPARIIGIGFRPEHIPLKKEMPVTA